MSIPDDPEFFGQAYYAATRGQPGDQAELYCLVMSRRSGARTIFWDVTDGTMTGTLQVGVRRTDFSDDEWESIRSIKKGARLRIKGLIGVTTKGLPAIWLDAFPVIQEYSFPETLAAIEPHRQRIAASLFVAHFRSLAEPVLTELGYVQIDVRLLAKEWHGDEGPFTLKALYPGFGQPMFLAPSPSPQLVEALIATGRDRVFTSSSLLTSSYRERSDGSEASVIMAKTLNNSLDRLIHDSKRLLNVMLDGVGALDKVGIPESWSENRAEWPEHFPVEDVASPQVHIYRREGFPRGRLLELARFLLPPGYAPIEAVTEIDSHGVPLGTIVLYLERLLPLVRHLPIRRLHSIEPLFPSLAGPDPDA